MSAASRTIELVAARLEQLLFGTAIVIVLGAWLWLGLGAFAAGPSEWDDHLYCQLAISPTQSWEVINRYAHVWGLRLSYLGFGARGLTLYPLLATLVAGLGAYVVGRLAIGRWCGLVAMISLPLFPAILRYLDAPFCDISMGAYSMLAMAFAGLAVEARGTETKRHWYWIAASGLACFLAAKSKETGLAVTPAVLWMLLDRANVRVEGLDLQGATSPLQAATLQRRLWAASRLVLVWSAGALFAWILLACADGIFLGDFGHSFKPETYLHRLPSMASSAANHRIVSAPKFGTDFLELLTTHVFWGWLVLATAGGLHGFKRSAIVRGLVLWASSSILLSALIASVYSGIYAVPRYLVVPGMPFVVLGAYYIVAVWRLAIAQPSASLWLRAVLIGTACLLLLGARSDSALATRSADFLLPWLLVFLVLLPMHTQDKWAGRAAIVIFAIVVAHGSLVDGLAEQLARRQRMAPWDRLAHHLEALRKDSNSVPGVALYRLGKPFSELRVQRRLVARLPALWDGVTVRAVRNRRDLDRSSDVIITRPKRAEEWMDKGWKQFAAARVPTNPESGRIDFVVLVRAERRGRSSIPR